jgi:2'-5' RNA ligase
VSEASRAGAEVRAEPRAKSRRLFVGIALDDLARERCAKVAEQLRRAGFAARYETPEKYHITLAFLGNITPAQLEPIESSLNSLSRITAMQITLDRLGGFPHERRPRVVFVGARDQGRAFAHLATETRKRYAALGFALANGPVAHVTVARVKAPQRPLPLIEVEPTPIEITALSLFESLPDRDNNTSRYEILRTIALAAPT